MVDVYIAVMNYNNSHIDSYTIEMKPDWQCDDVEVWLLENTSYNESYCYYMVSEEPIGYYVHDLNEGDED